MRKPANALNAAQVSEMFEQEAVLFCEGDGVAQDRAVELFGIEAVRFALTLSNTNNHEVLGDDFELPYLTRRGFSIAAAIHNAELFRDTEQQKQLENAE